MTDRLSEAGAAAFKERALSELRADNERLARELLSETYRPEGGEIVMQELVRVKAERNRLWALLDPDNEEAVELLLEATWDATISSADRPWKASTEWYRTSWRKIKSKQIHAILAALRNAATKEGATDD